MSNQRRLTALLHELQHARSPLAQARILARSWRTLRELGPTDRKLLARHAGFEGAEEILEGLGQKGGLAPAMLLRVLGNARSTDDSAVAELLAAFRDPDRRREAVTMSAELASDLLAEPEVEEVEQEIGDALEEAQDAEETIVDEPEEAPIAPEDPRSDEVEPPAEATPTSAFDEETDPQSGANDEIEFDSETEQQPETMIEEASAPEPEVPPPPPRRPEPVVDWSRWQRVREDSQSVPHYRHRVPPAAADAETASPEMQALIEIMKSEVSALSRLRLLRRETPRLRVSSTADLSQLMETFPDGWRRRRALCALLEAHVVPTIDAALELVSMLARESDRRWCLGVLARQGGLSATSLDRALELVSSPASRKRLRMAARS